ncbi:cytochrome b [Azohydromonas australica]|uniref:cytochrome b n=1 Tax=Azohydromonas australica TaxID=364039 RepID=UPI0007E8C5DF|nr:cytochrome b [Azohydromonas australica]
MNTQALVGKPDPTVPALQTSYHAGSAVLHWLTALLVLALVPLGASLDGLPRVQASFMYYNIHKWLGVTVFFLTCARLLWRLRHPAPALAPSMALWERRAAKIVHVLLYTLLLSIPLVGWMGSSAGGYPVVLFNVLPLPAPVPKSKELDDLLSGIHGILAWTLVTLAGLHLLAVIKHQFMDGDRVLSRMVDGLKRR